MAAVAVLLLMAGYLTGNPLAVRLLGGNEVDIALIQNRFEQEQVVSTDADTGVKNYLQPLPKYSYLSEDEADLIANPSYSSDDTLFYKAFPELMLGRDTLMRLK